MAALTDMKLWLIGAGGMALDYVRVLAALRARFEIIGRGDKSASRLESTAGVQVVRGGLEKALAGQRLSLPDCAIIAVGVEALAPVATLALEAGIRRLLVEKPAGLNGDEIRGVHALAARLGAEVHVAYNRRFYGSVLMGRKIIEADGGVSSFSFEFTELGDEIGKLQKAPGVREHWVLANSTHVIDLAFHLGGVAVDLHAIRSGSLAWHPSGAVFAGAGRAGNGALFSYHANWTSAGRWGVEVNTPANRLILRPLETLQIMKKGTFTTETVNAADASIDSEFKPGLFREVSAFLSGDGRDTLCSLEEHVARLPLYEQIAGYGEVESHRFGGPNR